MNTCYMLRQQEVPRPCFIQLGRYGDLILLFPAFQAVYERTGIKPVVVVANEYASVFDGVSYAEAIKLGVHWYGGMPKARELANSLFGTDPVVPQWWHEAPDPRRPVDGVVPGGTVLQCHGFEWGVDIQRWPNFMASMWERAGFTQEEMRRLPLVFDRRSPEREGQLVRQFIKPGKPTLLVNFNGFSSPFAPMPEVMGVVNEFRHKFYVVDLGQVRAGRIYDLLGLMEAAAGMITIDTATLHLAHGTKIPHIAYIVDGWSGSVPRGNVLAEIRYSQTIEKLDLVRGILEKL